MFGRRALEVKLLDFGVDQAIGTATGFGWFGRFGGALAPLVTLSS